MQRTAQKKADYFSANELLTMIYGKRLKDVVLFDELNYARFTERELKLGINALLRREVLKVSGDTFILAQPYDEMLEIMKNSVSVLVEDGNRMQVPERCIYSYGNMLAMQLDAADSANIRMEVMSGTEFLNDIRQYAFMPEDDATEDAEAKEVHNSNIIDLMNADREILMKRDDILICVDRYSSTGSFSGERLAVIHESVEDFIVIKKWHSIISMPYTFEKFTDSYLDMAGGHNDTC